MTLKPLREVSHQATLVMAVCFDKSLPAVTLALTNLVLPVLMWLDASSVTGDVTSEICCSMWLVSSFVTGNVDMTLVA